MSPVSRYGRWYRRGSYSDRIRTILAVAIVVVYLLAKSLVPGLSGLLIGMQVPFLVVAFLLFLAWPVGAIHDKRIATATMLIFLALLALRIL
jgi:hypothetical protein